MNQVIIEWCWRLIEKDLITIRMLIDSARVNWGVISRIDLQRACPEELQTLAADLCREINSLTDEKFRLLARWFTKPTNLAPSTSLSLLLDAVLDEVKGQFPDYEPRIELAGGSSQTSNWSECITITSTTFCMWPSTMRPNMAIGKAIPGTGHSCFGWHRKSAAP